MSTSRTPATSRVDCPTGRNRKPEIIRSREENRHYHKRHRGTKEVNLGVRVERRERVETTGRATGCESKSVTRSAW
jgi:hypothetical protein